MMSKIPTKEAWQETHFGDVITTLTDYHANGSYEKLKENVSLLDEPNYAVMIRTTNFEQRDFSYDLKYISKEAYDFMSKSKVYPDDILMNKIANAGSVYLMPDLRQPVSLAMNLFLIRTNPDLVDQRFIYYYLKTNEAYIKGFAIGTAARTITKEAVRNLKLKLPQLKVQRTVSSIISLYDDLIENNSRRIVLLEEATQRLYEEWFVHLRFPDYQNTGFHKSDNDRIPDGWSYVLLSDVTTKNPAKYNDELHNDWPLLDLGRIPQRSLSMITYGSPSELATSRIIFQRYDILFSSIRPYLHKVTFANTDGVTNTSVHVLKTSASLFPYLISLLFNSRSITWADTHSNGTKMPVISWPVLGTMKILLPPATIIDAFRERTQPFFDEILTLNGKNLNLRKTRDILLPKLITGGFPIDKVKKQG